MKLRVARKIYRAPKAGHTHRTAERAARRLRRYEGPKLIIVSPKKARDALTTLTMQRYLNHSTARLIEESAVKTVMSALLSGEVFYEATDRQESADGLNPSLPPGPDGDGGPSAL